MRKAILVPVVLGLAISGGLTSCGNRNVNRNNADATDATTTIGTPQDAVEVEVVEGTEPVTSSDYNSYTVSSGYSNDPDYRPTVSDDGDYHTIDGKRRQIQYQGSREQQRDLDMIDEYMRTHPEF